jgi:hypothetical protein
MQPLCIWRIDKTGRLYYPALRYRLAVALVRIVAAIELLTPASNKT